MHPTNAPSTTAGTNREKDKAAFGYLLDYTKRKNVMTWKAMGITMGGRIDAGNAGTAYRCTLDGKELVAKLYPLQTDDVNLQAQAEIQAYGRLIPVAKRSPNFSPLKTSAVVNKFPDTFDVLRPDEDMDHKLVLVMEHAGSEFGQGYLTADVATSILRQFVLSTMLANEAGVFQNDPNFGNLLVKETKEDQLVFKMNRQKMKVKSHGVLHTIIDFSAATNVLDPTSPPHEDVASLAQKLKELAASDADRDKLERTFAGCATATSMQDIYPNSDLFKD